ncbi:MAG: RadC family protein [Lachnospirales bacterium]
MSKKKINYYKLLKNKNVYVYKRKVSSLYIRKKYLYIFRRNKPSFKLFKPEYEKTKNPKSGHRQRVRDNIVKNGINEFSDRNLLEVMLFYAYPMKDTKAIADKLIDKFGSLDVILSMDIKTLMATGMTENTAVLMHLFSAIGRRQNINYKKRKEIVSVEDAKELCCDILKYEKNESFYILYLNSKKVYLGYEKVSEGTITKVSINLRSIMNGVNQFNATYIILVHNHPSGNPFPSFEDIENTKVLKSHLKPFEVFVCDHIIVGFNKAFSFVEENLL